MRRGGCILAVLSAGLLVMPSAQAAPGAMYQQCDGYGSPSSDGDGMTKEATQLFGIIGTLGSAGNTRRTTPPLGATGIAACDAALADSRLPDRYWMRRVSLLRARALHRVAGGDMKGAAADLDAAEAAVREPGNPYYQRSLGLGIKLTRAFVLARDGDAERAWDLAGTVLAARPFDRRMALGVLAVVHDEAVPVNGQPLLWWLARTVPKAMDGIYQDAFKRGDFARAIALYPQLAPPTKTGDVGVGADQTQLNDMRNQVITMAFLVQRQAERAYALAATGDHAAARQQLVDTASFLAASKQAAMPPPVPGIKEKREDREARELANVRAVTADRIAPLLLAWRELVEARIGVAEGQLPLNLKELGALPRNGAARDLLAAIKRVRPDFAGIDAAIAAASPLPPEPEDLKEDAKFLFDSMPHAEIAKRIPTFRKANSDFVGYLWGGISGFTTVARPDKSGATVRFVGESSSGSVVEEMALLRAADLAREAGKGGFVIRQRRDYERTRNTTYYGMVLRSDPDGYSTEIEVDFVDLDPLPEVYRLTPWRVLKAEEIFAQLGPV